MINKKPDMLIAITQKTTKTKIRISMTFRKVSKFLHRFKSFCLILNEFLMKRKP